MYDLANIPSDPSLALRRFTCFLLNPILPSQRLQQLEGGQEVLKSLLSNTGQSLAEVRRHEKKMGEWGCLLFIIISPFPFLSYVPHHLTQVKKSLSENVQQMAANIKVVDGRIEEALARRKG